MGNPFWQNRINPLRKDKKAPDGSNVGAFAFGPKGSVVSVLDSGEVESFANLDGFLGYALDLGAPFTWYTHLQERADLGQLFDRYEGFDALLDGGYHVRLFQTQNRTAALEVFDGSPEPATNGAPPPHWSIRDLRNIVKGKGLPRDPQVAAALTLRRVLDLDNAVHARFGTRLEMTATRTGYMAWRRTLGTFHWRQPKPARREIRAAYRGGYTRAFTTKHHHSGEWREYDIRSAYPAAMRQGVPIGQPKGVGPDYDQEFPDAVGFYYVKAFLNPRGLPVLMAWTEDYGDRPIERGIDVELWCSSQELQLARELGVVARVLYGWVYPKGIGQPFGTFVNVCEAWRDTAANGSESDMVKLIQNTLYGKFGTEPTQTEVVISNLPPKGLEWGPHYGQHAPIGSAWSRTVNTDGQAGHMIHWAAWITATVRCQIIRAVRDLGPDNVLYVDTDCIITRGELPTGERYGDWVLKHVFQEFQAYAGKRYVGRTVDGDAIVRAAGVALSMSDDERMAIMVADFERSRAGP